jgi:very-short-patch-repair endonuclease
MRAAMRGTTPSIKLAAKQLRKTLTPAEEVLWNALRNRQLAGLKFRRQYPVGRFILDFYCSTYKLVIEVDGEIHDHQIDYDTARTQHLQSYGYRVLRFSNQQVLANFPAVLSEIATIIEAT